MWFQENVDVQGWMAYIGKIPDDTLVNGSSVRDWRTKMNLDSRTVEKLEEKIEEAVAQVIIKMGLKKLPLLPDHHTMHLMAKAAVSVYEAAVENHRREE